MRSPRKDRIALKHLQELGEGGVDSSLGITSFRNASSAHHALYRLMSMHVLPRQLLLDDFPDLPEELRPACLQLITIAKERGITVQRLCYDFLLKHEMSLMVRPAYSMPRTFSTSTVLWMGFFRESYPQKKRRRFNRHVVCDILESSMPITTPFLKSEPGHLSSHVRYEGQHVWQ